VRQSLPPVGASAPAVQSVLPAVQPNRRGRRLAVQAPPFAFFGYPLAPSGGVKFLGVGSTGGCACCPGTTCIQFLGCNGSALQGVVVKIYDHSGGTLLAGPLTSDANGKVCTTLSTGSYWIDPTNGGGYSWPLDHYVWVARQQQLAVKQTVLWGASLIAGWGCCSTVNFPLPRTLYLTVCSQTFPLVSGPGAITGWQPVGVSTITTAGVAVVTTCNLGGWDGVSTSTQTVPWAVLLRCPSGPNAMVGLAGVCGIGHYNGHIGGFDAYAICPAACIGAGNAYTCCSGGAGPGASVPFTLTGSIGASVSLSGSMPNGMSSRCVFPPANPWALPCAGQTITVTN